jgi:hypothetical protein
MSIKNKLSNFGISSDKDLQELAKKLNIPIYGIIDFRDIKAPLPLKVSCIVLQRNKSSR